eukprot:7380268-Prymnesium_polylepis.1
MPRQEQATAVAVGGVKANLGHAEPAAGMAGLLKLVVVLRVQAVAANAQLRVLNPHVSSALAGMLCALPASVSRVADVERMGGVSSFGFSGTIAHTATCLESTDHTGEGGQPCEPVLRYRRRAFTWRDVPASPASLGSSRAYVACWTAAAAPLR